MRKGLAEVNYAKKYGNKREKRTFWRFLLWTMAITKPKFWTGQKWEWR